VHGTIVAGFIPFKSRGKVNMIKQLHKQTSAEPFTTRKKKKRIDHAINASHELSIMQHITTDQLHELKQSYTYMLEAINEAIKSKAEAEQRKKDMRTHGVWLKPYNDRVAMKIAYLWEHGKKSKEIDSIMGVKLGYCLNRSTAAHGRALINQRLMQAKNNMVIKLVNAGHGIRPTARAIPSALGKCSPALVCKIMKSYKLRQQAPLPFPLSVVK